MSQRAPDVLQFPSHQLQAYVSNSITSAVRRKAAAANGLVGSAEFFQRLVLMCIFARGTQPRVRLPLGPTNLVRVADLRTAVTGVPHTITVSVFLVTIGNFLAVVQDVFYSCERAMLP